MQLTTHFSLEELTRSQYAARNGINNVPTDPQVLANLRVLAEGAERVRAILSVPVDVSSGYRCAAVNKAEGGAPTSQHLKGQAIDFYAPDYGTPLQICHAIVYDSAHIQFDQLIMEGTWVHCSFITGTPRGEVLTAHFNPGGRTTYSPGLAPL
jgi:zinc D-Ala-D-Ala carboxypeptidase